MYYTIAEAARKSGLTAHTLRYYDKEGLLPSVERSPTGIRRFREADLEWLAVISCLKNTGMPVKRIREFLEWCQEGDSRLQERLNIFLEQKKRVEQQIAELRRCEEKIDHKIRYYKTALEAGTEEIHKNRKKECLAEIKEEMTSRN